MNKKNVLSLLIVCGFILTALGSKVVGLKLNTFHIVFNPRDFDNETSEKGNYIILNGGSFVYGEKITYSTGIIGKGNVKVDGQKYEYPDVVAMFVGNTYFRKIGKEFANRVMHGRINIYLLTETRTQTTRSVSGAMETRTTSVNRYFAQKGETGSIVPIMSSEDLRALVADCPKSREMVQLTDKQLRKAVRKNRSYLNDLIRTYNNDCK